jgi:glycine cleavage system transcriptional repressor
VLHGYFTLIMIVSFRQETDPQRLREAVAGSSVGQAGFGVHVRPFQPVEPVVLDGENFVITAFGPDREGVIARFSAFLADKGINIIDLFGDRKGDQFVLIGQVCVPGRWDTQLIQADLEQMAADSGYTVRLQHENVFVATNELRLTRGRPKGG